jgi:hypothetical protein
MGLHPGAFRGAALEHARKFLLSDRLPGRSESPQVAGRSLSGPTPSPEEQALERLNRALGPIPSPAIASVLDAANRRLQADGFPPCAVRSPTGEMSIALAPAGKSPEKPLLVPALSRCADAIEQVMR